jgi:uncharacterized repeat protein (TIGR01451 family)
VRGWEGQNRISQAVATEKYLRIAFTIAVAAVPALGVPGAWAIPAVEADAAAPAAAGAATIVEPSASRAVLAPILGPETALDSPVVGPASGRQSLTATAYDPSSGTYLVAWSDSRSSTFGQIYATRVDSGGAVLDPEGILLSDPAKSAVAAPVVVFDGTNFLVVFAATCRTWGRRVTSAGAIVDPAPFPISPASSVCETRASAASDGGAVTLVVWENNATTSNVDISGARVQGSSVLDPGGIPISTSPHTQSLPRVTYGAGNWLVVWEDWAPNLASRDVSGARVSPSGTVLDPLVTGIAISTLPASDESSPWPASDGSAYFVVWTDGRNPSPDIYGARVTASGVVVDLSGLAVCNQPDTQGAASVAWGAGSYQVVWEDFRGPGPFGNRVVPATGALLDGPAGTAIAGTAPITDFVRNPRIFAAGSGFYLGWDRNPEVSLPEDVAGSRVTTAPFLLDAPGVGLTTSANGETQVAAAADGANHFVVWVDDRGGTRAIYGARVDGATGASLDPTGILLSPTASSEFTPAVSFNGSQYLVVWLGSAGIRGARVSTAGTVLDPNGLALFMNANGNVPGAPDVASDGTGWLVTWADSRNFATTGRDIYAGRVTSAGVALDPAGIVVSNAPGDQEDPHLGFGAGYYLLAWADRRSGTSYDLYAARVDAVGVVEPAGIPIAVGPGHVPPGNYGVAYANQSFVVAYVEEARLARARVAAASGVVQDTLLLTPANVNVATGAITYAGDTFLVAYGTSHAAGFGIAISGTRLDTNGADIDPVDWDVVTAVGVPRDNPALAALTGTPGKALVPYTRYDGTAGVTSDRAWSRLITHGIEADLGVTKTDGQTTAVPGLPITYTITVTNLGPSTVTGATVMDLLGPQLVGGTWTCVASLGSSCGASGSGNINDIVNLLVGGTATYTLGATVATWATGTLLNMATVTGPGGVPDPDPSNNSATDIDTLAPQADVELIKADAPDPVLPGSPLKYTLTLHNLGPSDATFIVLEDFLPPQVFFVSVVPTPPFCGFTGSSVTCMLGNMAPGGTITVTINTINNAASGVLLNEAVVSADEPDPDLSNNTDTETTLVGIGKGELVHGTDAVHDLAALPGPVADVDVFRINQKPYSSYEVVIDATSGDIGAGAGPELVRLAPNGNTVVQTSVPVGIAHSRSLRWQNSTANEVETGTIRVRSALCTTDCGPDDVYRIRAYETTYSAPRFNNSGTQITVLVLQNPTDYPITGDAYFQATSGALAGFRHFILAPRETLVLNTTSVPGVSGLSGALTVAHDGRYGDLTGKTVALEPATGFSFDTPLVPRAR